jgi:hypothetical protein
MQLPEESYFPAPSAGQHAIVASYVTSSVIYEAIEK